jgi:hypothetical protein
MVVSPKAIIPLVHDYTSVPRVNRADGVRKFKWEGETLRFLALKNLEEFF